MKTRWLAAGIITAAVGLTGCGSAGSSGATSAGQAASTPAAQTMAGMSMAPGETMAGMSMAPGETMAGMSMAPGETMAGMSAAPAADQPSKAAKMVCSADMQGQVKLVLKLAKPAPVTTRWQDQRYGCTYALPMGPLVMSVQQSEDKAAARGYFEALRRRLGRTEPLAGLGESAYATTTGIAVVLKDNLTLQVDATGLPPVFGPQQQRRTDLAYELASDVLGCWTGDE
jgi:hypothetical protein